MKISDLIIGNKYSNQEITSIFKCSTQGGMRRSKKKNTLILISNHIKSIYNDRWKNNILYYTGMGRIGDQELTSQNKTLAESHNNIDIHLFEVFKDKEYTYSGKVILHSTPYQEKQLDENNKLRNVYIFPLKLETDYRPITSSDWNECFNKKEKKLLKLSTKELLEKATISSEQIKSENYSKILIKQYQRDPAISAYAKKIANGICQLCSKPAPFENNNGSPFLEVHHIDWLSKGGLDTIENTIALCPNCHRKMHILNNEDDINYLKNKVKERI